MTRIRRTTCPACTALLFVLLAGLLFAPFVFAAPAADGKIEAAFTKPKSDYLALKEDKQRRQ